MNALTRPVRSYPLAAFFVLACLFGWVLHIAPAAGFDTEPNNLPLGPIIAAAIVLACLGRAELRGWARRLVDLRAPLGWYALAIAGPIVLVVAAVVANTALGAPAPTPEQLAGWTALPMELVGILILIGIGEEAGWTAFAGPRLLDRHPFLVAWAILTAMRVAWHLPLMLAGDLPWVLGIFGNLAFGFLLLWTFARTGQWFLAAVWHAVHNTVSGSFFFQMAEGDAQARLGVLLTLMYVLAAVAVLLIDRRRLTAPRPDATPVP